jgi:hypothetical protein
VVVAAAVVMADTRGVALTGPGRCETMVTLASTRLGRCHSS